MPGTGYRFTSYDEFLPTSIGRFAGASGGCDVVVTITGPASAWYTMRGTVTIPKG